MKKVMISLLIGLSVLSVSCNENPENVNKNIQETVNKLENDFVRIDLANECDKINNDYRHVYSSYFKIDDNKNEVRFVFISPNEENKITSKEGIDKLYIDIYQIVKINNKYDGELFTDFCLYDEYSDSYTIYYNYTYKDGKGKLIPVKKELSRNEFFEYYNN